MQTKHLKPNPEVAAFVEWILVIEDGLLTVPFALPLFANGTPTLLFISAKGSIANKPAAHLTLFGQTVLPDTLTIHEGFELIAYFFKPHSLTSIFGIMPPELTDQPIDLYLLSSKKTTTLEDQLLNANSTVTRIGLLDHFITGLMANAKGDCPIVQYAANKIQHQPSPEILKEIQKELHLTERTFQRLFEKNIGLAPNLYRRVCQFNSAFVQLNNRKYNKLSDLALENGYADQSHYIRSFKEFTHLLPSEYLSLGEPSRQ
jgi:AraC-like DNA-binding protein